MNGPWRWWPKQKILTAKFSFALNCNFLVSFQRLFSSSSEREIIIRENYWIWNFRTVMFHLSNIEGEIVKTHAHKFCTWTVFINLKSEWCNLEKSFQNFSEVRKGQKKENITQKRIKETNLAQLSRISSHNWQSCGFFRS